MVKFGHAVFEICEQIYIQTDTLITTLTAILYRGQSNDIIGHDEDALQFNYSMFSFKTRTHLMQHHGKGTDHGLEDHAKDVVTNEYQFE